MIELSVVFFDKTIGPLFLNVAAAKITNTFDRRNVEREISRAAEAPAQMLHDYFQNERLEQDKVAWILEDVRQAPVRGFCSANLTRVMSCCSLTALTK